MTETREELLAKIDAMARALIEEITTWSGAAALCALIALTLRDPWEGFAIRALIVCAVVVALQFGLLWYVRSARRGTP